MSAGGRAWRGMHSLLQRRRSILAKGKIPVHLDTQQRQVAKRIPIALCKVLVNGLPILALRM
eukprot:9499228-Prorocentrum_lima.AAC.1